MVNTYCRCATLNEKVSYKVIMCIVVQSMRMDYKERRWYWIDGFIYIQAEVQQNYIYVSSYLTINLIYSVFIILPAANTSQASQPCGSTCTPYRILSLSSVLRASLGLSQFLPLPSFIIHPILSVLFKDNTTHRLILHAGRNSLNFC